MTDEERLENFLAHYGVPGMKWGKRRAQNHKQGKAERAVNRKLRGTHKKAQARNIRNNALREVRGQAPLKASQHVGNKATRGAAYAASFLIGNKIGAKAGALTGSLPLAALGGAAGAAAGITATNRLLKNVGQTRMDQLD